jgi:hypothetical protein
MNYNLIFNKQLVTYRYIRQEITQQPYFVYQQMLFCQPEVAFCLKVTGLA